MSAMVSIVNAAHPTAFPKIRRTSVICILDIIRGRYIYCIADTAARMSITSRHDVSAEDVGLPGCVLLAAPNAHLEWKGPKFTGQLHIGLETAEEVDALWAKVKDRVKVIYAVDDFEYDALLV